MIAKRFHLSNYARLDCFFNRLTGQMILIEINTLPALTPSTVLFHQALTQHPPLAPLALLEVIISINDKCADHVIQQSAILV